MIPSLEPSNSLTEPSDTSFFSLFPSGSSEASVEALLAIVGRASERLIVSPRVTHLVDHYLDSSLSLAQDPGGFATTEKTCYGFV